MLYVLPWAGLLAVRMSFGLTRCEAVSHSDTQLQNDPKVIKLTRCAAVLMSLGLQL